MSMSPGIRCPHSNRRDGFLLPEYRQSPLLRSVSRLYRLSYSLISFSVNARLTKKALLLLCLSPKSSFTSSKLRFWSLRKPENSSYYSNLNIRGFPILHLGPPPYLFPLIIYKGTFLSHKKEILCKQTASGVSHLACMVIFGASFVR